MSIAPAHPRRPSQLLAAAANRVVDIEYLEARRLMAASLPKIGSVLNYLATDFSTRPEAKLSRSAIRNKVYTLASGQPNKNLLHTVGDTVLVKVVPNTSGAKTLVTQLQNIGASVVSGVGSTMTAAVPVSALAKVGTLSALNYADAYYAPMTSAGKVDDYGVTAMKADRAADQYGVTGAGVRVGVLSDSYNNLGTAAADVTSGDLPQGGVTVVKDLASGGTDEGRAMAQIVHDVAPGAAISFYTAFGSESDFANGIVTLAKPTSAGGQGAQVIVDDVFYLDEPFFQDGQVAQAVNVAANTYGASYFSSAGNFARSAYESAFRGVNTTVAGAGTGTFQNFNSSGGTQPYQTISIASGAEFRITLEWNTPFYSASNYNNNSPIGAANSLAAYLINSTNNSLLTSQTTNRVNTDGYQILDYTNNTGAAITAKLAIMNNGGTTAPTYLKYVDYGSATATDWTTSSGASFGHSSATGAMGVGAAYYGATPAFNATATLEPFSSSGGTPFFFNANGTPLATPTYRNQPAIVAPDGAATTFFGGLSGDGLNHFYGTSAAAPHAAGVAALMLQAKPSLTNTQIYSTLENTALDMGTAGYDYDTGYGLLQADKALAAVAGGQISGVEFRDINNDHIKNGSDYGLAGQTVFLDSNGNHVADSLTRTYTNSTSLAIPDGGTTTTGTTTNIYGAPSRISSTQSISDMTGRVTKITVSLSATHSYASDLGFTLISPSGIRVPLMTNAGGGNAAGAGYNITLDDAVTTLIESKSPDTSTSTITGTYKPQTQLAALIGENPNGTWTLEARDYYYGDTGTLNNWSITIAAADPTTTTDASGNYTFTSLTPSSYYGTYNVAAAAVAGLTQTTPSTSEYNLAVAGATSTANFGQYAPISTVASIVLDDGTAQRSRVRGATVTFNGTIPQASIASGAFTLTQTSGTIASYAANVASVTSSAGQTVVTLTFAGSAVVGGSVADGHYTLAIDGSKIIDSTGLAVDAAGNGTPGSSRQYNFYRYYGDIDGNGYVDNGDLPKFTSTYGRSSSDASFISAFDYDGNGYVDNGDLPQFTARYGKAAV